MTKTGATCQEMMKEVFKDKIGNMLEVYMDDMIDMKDQLNEINQGLNLKVTRRVEDVQYGRP